MNRRQTGDLAVNDLPSQMLHWAKRTRWLSCIAYWACFVLFPNALAIAQEAIAVKSASISNHREIDQALEAFIAKHEIAGAVTAVVEKDRILHLGAVGNAELGSDAHPESKPMTHDSIFWIASMSKPVTGVCVMQLVDQGKCSLEDPIDRFLPDMSELKDESGKKHSITIAQLLNHTSGMRELSEPYSSKTLAEASAKYAKAGPLHFAPGSQWQYSQTSINTAARIVEVVSGLSFDEYARKFLFEPLGMKDTGFYLTNDQAQRLAVSYTKNEQGSLVATPIFLLAGKQPTDRERLPAANGGLFSTASDYAKFCQMLLGDGTAHGAVILSKAAVTRLRTPSTGDLTTGFTPGNAWGVGVCVVMKPQGATAMLSPGAYGHGGAYGTQAWIDPTTGRAYILMVQRANFPNADDSEIRKTFQSIAAKIK